MRRVQFSAAWIGLAAVAAALAITAPARGAGPPRPVAYAGVNTYGKPVCGRYWVPVDRPGGNYSIVFNAQDGGTCVSVGRGGSWWITYRAPFGSARWQMPHEMWGEAWGRDSCHAGPSGTSATSRCMIFPEQVSRDGSPRFSVLYWPHGYSQGNAALDIWFFREPVTPARATVSDGTELMIWPGRPGIPLANYRHVHLGNARIGGQAWYVMGWLMCPQGVCHHYIAFLAYHQVTREAGLYLNPFFRYAEELRQLSPAWYLTSIDWGYEQNCQCNGILTTYANLTGIPTYSQVTRIRGHR